MQQEILTGIIETAKALDMSPVDLATIVSYETGGTFDPTQKGPTTKWGQHKGLIQFGEVQAKQYGVDWNDPVGSQLGPDGAVARYFRDNGWQPGMSLEDAYSIVNAGAPGRYSASDAHAGGAPGTVRDKVASMGAHRAKAVAMLGGDPSGTQGALPSRSEPQAEPRSKPQSRPQLGFPMRAKGDEPDELQEALMAFFLSRKQEREGKRPASNLGFSRRA